MKVAIVLFVCIVTFVAAQSCVNPGCKTCGNGICEIGETPCLCPLDCQGCCVDGSCRQDRGENFRNCPADCAFDLQVQVIEQQTGNVLSGAVINCFSSEDWIGPAPSMKPTTVFNGVYEANWTCTAQLAGYFPNSATQYLSPAAKCVSVPVIVIPLTFDTCCIFGHVFNAQTGVVVPGAKINCQGPIGSFNDTVSDPSGNWFREVRPGSWTCTASAPGFSPVTFTKPYLPGEKSPWRFFLPPLPGTVTGQFRDSKNFTALLSTVSCTDASGNQYSFTGNNFTFTNVAPGPVTCTASKYFFFTQTQTKNLPSSGLINFDFLLVEIYGNLQGTVIDGRTGYPLSNVLIDCMSMWDMGMTLTNAGGYYYLGGLKGAPFMCMATHKGYMDGWLNQVVDLNQTNFLNFVLLPIEAVVTGRVHLYDLVPGAPVANASISCWTNDYHGIRYQITTQANATGDYRIGDIYGFGELTCIFTAPGYAPSSRSIKYWWQDQIQCNIPMVKL